MNTPRNIVGGHGARGFAAGAAQVDVTPRKPLFLYGYPHVPRISEGVHDPLLASALYVDDGRSAALFIACDVIWVPREPAQRARQRIEQVTGVPAGHIMVSATHTHSGPVTGAVLSNAADPVVPAPDAEYMRQLEDGIVEAAAQAWRHRTPATLATAVADGSGLGTNRRDPAGPSLPDVPLLIARDAGNQQFLAVMAVCAMHPTVLHEDWRQISGDFPGLARQWLQQNAIGGPCPFIYHMGASGNQSPRHVVAGNTIEEAQRLGEHLGRAVAAAIDRATVMPAHEQPMIEVRRSLLDLPVRSMPSVATAQAACQAARQRFEQLQKQRAPKTAIRTAECDWFGAEETLTLAQAATDGKLARAARSSLPAEVQAIRIGAMTFVGWPGEVFVEFALRIKQRHPNAAIITLANGGLQGYLVTREAAQEGGYEASNALFASPDSGDRLVEATLELLADGG